MSKKARAIFLSVSFTLFLASSVIFLVPNQRSYSESDYIYIPFWEAFRRLCVIPVLVNELSWIRSTYKLLKYRPERVKKVCYIISSALSFSSIVFFLLSWAVLAITRIALPDFVIFGYLFLGWPTVFVSFVLGSIPVRKRKGAGGASIGDAPPADPAAETRPENSDAE